MLVALCKRHDRQLWRCCSTRLWRSWQPTKQNLELCTGRSLAALGKVAVAKRQKLWARQARLRLISALGGCCAFCHSQDDLQFDCLEPAGHRHHALEPSARISFYRREARRGNLRLLCADCHCEHHKTKRNQSGKTSSLVGHEPPGTIISTGLVYSSKNTIKDGEQ